MRSCRYAGKLAILTELLEWLERKPPLWPAREKKEGRRFLLGNAAPFVLYPASPWAMIRSKQDIRSLMFSILVSRLRTAC